MEFTQQLYGDSYVQSDQFQPFPIELNSTKESDEGTQTCHSAVSWIDTLEPILGGLNVIEAVKCRLVCRTWKLLIDGFATWQTVKKLKELVAFSFQSGVKVKALQALLDFDYSTIFFSSNEVCNQPEKPTSLVLEHIEQTIQHLFTIKMIQIHDECQKYREFSETEPAESDRFKDFNLMADWLNEEEKRIKGVYENLSTLNKEYKSVDDKTYEEIVSDKIRNKLYSINKKPAARLDETALAKISALLQKSLYDYEMLEIVPPARLQSAGTVIRGENGTNQNPTYPAVGYRDGTRILIGRRVNLSLIDRSGRIVAKGTTKTNAPLSIKASTVTFTNLKLGGLAQGKGYRLLFSLGDADMWTRPFEIIPALEELSGES